MVINATPSAPSVSSPVNYCQNATAVALTAAGSNLFWGSVSGSSGGTNSLTTSTWVETNYSNKKTNFTTLISNVKITSIDYTIPANQTVNGIQLALYNSAGSVIAISSTITTRTAGASSVKITNTFNYSIPVAGNYSVGIYAGTGSIGGDSPSFPMTEPSGTVTVTGVTPQGGAPYHCFNNIQFSTDGSTAPIPSTATVGTTNYFVTQTVNGCVSPQATIAVNVNAAPSSTISYPGGPFCPGGTATVSRTGAVGGSYSSTAGLSINAASGDINLSASTPGSYTVTYRIAASGGCSVYTTTANVVINATPPAPVVTSPVVYCQNATAVPLTATGSNLLWGPLNPVAPTPSTMTVGTTNYFVTQTVNGCVSPQATIAVNVNAAPSATISYSGSPYCLNAGSVLATRTGTAGGTFSSTAGLTINSSTGTIDLNSSTAGLTQSLTPLQLQADAQYIRPLPVLP